MDADKLFKAGDLMAGIALIVGAGSGNSASFARALAADGYADI